MLNVNKLSFLCFFLLVGISTIGCTSLTVQEYPEEVRTGTLSSPIPETPTSSTPLSTLTFAQRDVIRKREVLLEELMAKNENCQLPCWWGVQIVFSTATIWRMPVKDLVILEYQIGM